MIRPRSFEPHRAHTHRDLAMRLVELARRAVRACEPSALTAAAVRDLSERGVLPPDCPVRIVAMGKAAWPMTRGARAVLGDRLIGGVAVGKAQFEEQTELGRVRYLRGGHPEPTRASAHAADALLAELGGAGADEHVLALISGGASALCAGPLPGLSIGDLAATTRALLARGVPIERINVVRRQLSCTAGGRLARACHNPVDVLVVSDVVGNDLAVVGSGPFAPEPGGCAEAVAVARMVPGVPDRVLDLLERGAAGLSPALEQVDRSFARVRHHLLATPESLVEAASTLARDFGFSRVVAHAPEGGRVERVAERIVEGARELGPGELYVAGGEPTVELPPRAGVGGRNQQLALLVAHALAQGAPRGSLDGDEGAGPAAAEAQIRRPPPAGRGIVVVAVASDGEDGPTDAAGAWVDETTWHRIEEQGIEPTAALVRADAHAALDAVGALVRTGSTGTNVLDLHLAATSQPAAEIDARG